MVSTKTRTNWGLNATTIVVACEIRLWQLSATAATSNAGAALRAVSRTAALRVACWLDTFDSGFLVRYQLHLYIHLSSSVLKEDRCFKVTYMFISHASCSERGSCFASTNFGSFFLFYIHLSRSFPLQRYVLLGFSNVAPVRIPVLYVQVPVLYGTVLLLVRKLLGLIKTLAMPSSFFGR